MSLASRFCTIYNRLPTVLLPKAGQIRESSYKSSLFAEDVKPNTQYEVTKDPIEWEFVKRVLPPTVVPEPIKKDQYPSGWKPQEDNLSDRPYFIKRTKNHMIPCYLKISFNKQRRQTVLRNVQGDIWLLESELKDFIKPDTLKPLRVQVNEFAGYIRISGDYVNAVKYFLEEKGY